MNVLIVGARGAGKTTLIRGEPMYAGIQLINGDRFSLYVYESGK